MVSEKTQSALRKEQGWTHSLRCWQCLAAQVCLSDVCEETNLVLISNDHNSHEYVRITGPIFFIRRLKINYTSGHMHLFLRSAPSWMVPRQNVRRQNIRGQNVRGDKMSVGTKHLDGQKIRRIKRPCGQNVQRTKRPADKTSGGQNVRRTKRPADKTSGGQKVRGDKTSMGTKHPWTKRPSGSYLWWHDDASPNQTSLVISTLDYEPLWSGCPRVETDQRILRPKYFLSLDVASQPIFSVFWGLYNPPNFQT